METLAKDNYLEQAEEIDWTGCELVERVPGKVSGRSIVKGTRILADTIVQTFELGSTVDDIHEDFPDLSMAQIERLISFGMAYLRSQGYY